MNLSVRKLVLLRSFAAGEDSGKPKHMHSLVGAIAVCIDHQ